MAVKVRLKRKFWSGEYYIEVDSDNICHKRDFEKNKDYVISVMRKKDAKEYIHNADDGGFYEFRCGPYFPNDKEGYEKRFK